MEDHVHGNGDCTCDPGTHQPPANGLVPGKIGFLTWGRRGRRRVNPEEVILEESPQQSEEENAEEEFDFRPAVGEEDQGEQFISRSSSGIGTSSRQSSKKDSSDGQSSRAFSPSLAPPSSGELSIEESV